jgi:hypothetical protein
MAKYVEIVSVIAPSQAAQGGTVDITLKVRNTAPGIVGVMVDGTLEYDSSLHPLISFLDSPMNLSPNETKTFLGSYVMPNVSAKSVRMHINTHWYGENGNWYLDDEYSIDVGVKAPSSIHVLAPATGAYTQIHNISAPASANAGDSVHVSFWVKSLFNDYMWVATGMNAGAVSVEMSPDMYNAAAGQDVYFEGSFVMPAGASVEVDMRSFFWGSVPGGSQSWVEDDTASITIAGIATQYSLNIVISPTGAGQVVDNYGNVYPSSSSYPTGTWLTLNIPPKYQVKFSHWSGDTDVGDWYATYISVQMTKSRAITANFTGFIQEIDMFMIKSYNKV